jgi:ribosomal peptide maturation radical SAM protein 1
MTYRAKSPQRVLAELKALSQKYRITAFSAVDNILDLKYVEQLFGELERAKVDYRFFYEVKANLTRAQLQALYRGGVRSVQPGIESMSTHVLELMRKGCTMLQNVRFLKWCRYYNISTSWNLIHGFPGESDEDYRQELDVLKRISHLEPPGGSGRIWLERFSPYYTDGQKFPVRNRRPEPSYRYVYPETVDIDRVAYFFDYEMGDTVAANTHFETAAYVSEWQKTWHSDQRHTLSYRRTADGLLIDYHWGRERSGTYTLSGPLALMYELCGETMHTVERVVQYLRDLPEGYRIFADEVRDAMDEFCRGGLMLGEDGKYLSLAIPSNPNW